MSAKTIDERIEELARAVKRGFDAIKNDLHRLETRFREELATKADLRALATKEELREVEERLLEAVRGTEVKRRDIEALEDRIESIAERVAALEKRH